MERVTVVRGGTTVLQDVTLQAAEGELLVVLGSSGSGKSTLLRALVQTPDVFLLDEPLGDLDAVQRVEVRRQIVEIVRSLGVTTFYVTHDQAEGLAVADRIAVLHGAVCCRWARRGSSTSSGGPVRRRIRRRSGDRAAAGAAGVQRRDGPGFDVGTRTLPLWREVPPPLLEHVGREVVLGLRAEDVHGADARPTPDSVTLDAVVSGVEYTGRHNVLALLVGAAPAVVPDGELSGGSSLATLHAYFPPRAAIRPGDAVRIAVEAARAHVLDAVTGRALFHPEHVGSDERTSSGGDGAVHGEPG